MVLRGVLRWAYAEIGDVIGGIGPGWKVATSPLAQERSARLALHRCRCQGGSRSPSAWRPARATSPAGQHAHRSSGRCVRRRPYGSESGAPEYRHAERGRRSGASASIGKYLEPGGPEAGNLGGGSTRDRLDRPNTATGSVVFVESGCRHLRGHVGMQRNLIARSAGLPSSATEDQSPPRMHRGDDDGLQDDDEDRDIKTVAPATAEELAPSTSGWPKRAIYRVRTRSSPSGGRSGRVVEMRAPGQTQRLPGWSPPYTPPRASGPYRRSPWRLSCWASWRR